MTQKNNSGAIFKNTKKDKETHPDYRGSINVEGKDYDIALWLKESQSGMKYFSVGLSEPWKKDAASAEKVEKADSEDEDLPF